MYDAYVLGIPDGSKEYQERLFDVAEDCAAELRKVMVLSKPLYPCSEPSDDCEEKESDANEPHSERKETQTNTNSGSAKLACSSEKTGSESKSDDLDSDCYVDTDDDSDKDVGVDDYLCCDVRFAHESEICDEERFVSLRQALEVSEKAGQP